MNGVRLSTLHAPRAWLAVVALVACLPASRAAEAEERVFAVTVDGKSAGSHHLTLRSANDGAQTVSASVSVRLPLLLGSYTYSLTSTEVWKAGQLLSVAASSNDNGKKHTVRAAPADSGWTIVTDGHARHSRGPSLTSTGWREPAAGRGAALLLDTEDGTETPVRVDQLASSTLTVGHARVAARHYRLTGQGVETHWWFDGQGRPVRQEMKWDGHKVVLHLTAVNR